LTPGEEILVHTIENDARARWRPLSICSKVFYELGRLVNANSACMITVKGTLCPVTLARAADELARVHPMLRTVIRRKGMRLGWVETTGKPKVVEYPLPEDAPLDTLMTYVFDHTWIPVFSTRDDIPFRVHLFRNASYSIVQLVTSHVTEDARASYQISHDMARILASLAGAEHEAPNRVEAPGPDMDVVLFPGTSRLRWTGHFLKACGAIVRDFAKRDITLPLVRKPRFDGPAAPVRRGLIVRDIEPELFQGLRAAASARGASLHSLLLLAMCRIIWRRDGRAGKTIRMIDMMTLRGHGGRATENLYEIAVIPYQLRIRPGSDEDCLSQITQRIEALRKGEYRTELIRYRLTLKLLASVRHLPLLLWIIETYVQSRVLVSNPGRIPFDLEEFGGLPVCEFITYPQLFSPGAVMTQFSGFRDRVRLIMIFDPETMDANGGTALFDEFMAELYKMAGNLQTPVTRNTSNAQELFPA
jgi:hypothetical protein